MCRVRGAPTLFAKYLGMTGRESNNRFEKILSGSVVAFTRWENDNIRVPWVVARL